MNADSVWTGSLNIVLRIDIRVNVIFVFGMACVTVALRPQMASTLRWNESLEASCNVIHVYPDPLYTRRRNAMITQ